MASAFPLARQEALSMRSGRKVPNEMNNGNQYAHKTMKEEMFYLTTHSTHFIYCYMVLDIC